MNEEVLQKLYNNGSRYFSLPDFETFKTDMQDENKLNKFRESMSKYFSIPDIETLKSDIGFNSGKQEGVDTVAATAAPEEPQQPTTFQQPSPLLEQELPVGVASKQQLEYQEADPKVKLYADKIKSISDTELTQEQLDEIEKQVEEPTLTSRLVKSAGDFKTVTEEKYAYEDFLQQARQQYADQQNVDINTVTDEQATPIAKDILRSELVGQIKDEARKQVLDDFEDEYSEGFIDNLKKVGLGVARLSNFGLAATAGEMGLGKVIESGVLPEGISEEYIAPVKDFFTSVNETLTSKEDLEYEQGRKELKELISQASEDKQEQAKSKSKEIDLGIVKYDESVKKAEELKKTINEIDNKYKLGEELSEEEVAVYNSTLQEFNNVVKDINYLSNKLDKQVEELHDINVSSSDLEKAIDQAGRSYNALDVTVSRVVGSGLQLTSGALNLYDDFLSITPHGVMINAISDELGLPSITSSVLDDTEKTSLIESFADQLKDIDKEEFTGKVREVQNYKTAFKSGENFLDFALDVVSGQAVNTAVTAATGGLGLAILGGAAYGDKADELEDRIQGKGDYASTGPEDIPLWKYYTTSLIVGGAEAGSEYIGLKQVRALGKSIGRVAKTSPSNKAWYDLSTKKWSRKFAENVVQNAWQPIEEGGSEAIAQIAQNVADVYILGDDKNILEGVDEAFITGATFSGLAMSAPKTFVDAAVAFRSSDADARINKRTKKLGELALRKQEIKDKENKTQEDLDILKEITAEQEVLIQENYNEVKNVVTLLDELNFGQKQALIKNETKRAELIRKAKTISESKDLTKEQKESQIKELETQFKDLKNKKDSMLLRYSFDRQSQVSLLANAARANEIGKEIKIIEAENIEDAEIKVNAALDQALQDGSITQEEYNKSKKEFSDLKEASTKYSISGQAINADNNLPFMLTLKSEAIDPNNGDSFVHGHEFLHVTLFNKIRALGGNIVKISDLLYNHYKNNYITDKEQLRQFENDYKEIKQKGTKESESVWHEERIIAITKMISLAERSGKLDKSFLAKIKSAYNVLFTNPVEKTEAGKLKSGEDVFNMFLTYGTRFMSGDIKELVKLEKGLDIDASLIGEKIDTGSKFSRKALGDSIKALVPEGTTKDEYDSEVISTVYLDLIASNKLHPLINNNLARFGVPREKVTDEFYEDVKSQLFERSLQRFNPEKNDDLGGFVINELQRFAIPDIVNQYKNQGKFQTTEQVEAAPAEGRVRPMQIAEETTTEEVIERAEEQEVKTEEQTFREKLGIQKGGRIYNNVVNSVRRTFGTKLPSVVDSGFRKALISEFKRDLMKPIKDFVGKKKDYRDFIYNNFNTIMEKIPTREWVQIEAKQDNKIFAEVVRVNASPTQVDNAISEGLYLLPGAARTAGPTIYRKLEPTADQLWKFLTDNTATVNGARKTALVERIAQELAFDATMMVLKDPEYNAIARLQEIAELTGETLPDNFDAELGAIIERDPSITKFSKKEVYNKIVELEILDIDPNISNDNLRKIISLAAKGYSDQEFSDLMQDIYEDDYINKASQFENKFKDNSGILEALSNEINKLDNGNLYETIYTAKLNKLLEKYGLKAEITKAVKYDVAIKKGSKILFKIELKYGNVVNGPFLTSTVFKNVFDKNGKWNKANIKLFRNTGINDDIINNINNQESFINRLEEITDIAVSKYGATLKDNGFVIKDEELRKKFLKEIGSRPVNKYSETGITTEKQLSNLKKDVNIYHFSEDGAFEIPGSGLGLRPLNITTSNNTTLSYTGKGKFTIRMTLTATKLETTPLNNRNNITKDAGIEQVASMIIDKFSEGKFSKKAKDDKGVDKDAKARDILDQTFNTILEQTTGIKATREYSKAQARAAAQRKRYRSFFIPPSAEDFLGLMYAFLSPGKQGEKQLKFIEDNLITPMNEAFNNWAQAKYVVARDFRALRKKYKDVRKKLNKFVPGTDFTIDQAIRVYLYDKAGYTVPGISEAELKAANKFVTENQDIYNFANELRAITRIPEGFSKPDENWISSTLTGEMYEISQNVVRSQFFETVNENLDTIFNEANLNKIEAYYGPKFREALEDSIYRIKTGSNRNFGNNRLLNEFNNWLNGAVGTIMFLNTRSAVLQTISATNYINWSDNNMAKAAIAFGNQKQFWSDFAYLFNSPYLKERRSGLQSDINLAELQAAISGSKNKAKAAIRYLLQKGFVFTQIADSFAIASGGATFYRNRVKTYTKQGLSQKEAETKAFTDFQNLTETNQQSARPDKISQQQAGPLGRLILAFQNTPAQYAREMKKASLDLINGRGDWKTNLSKIAYYGAVQNLIFNAMQTALFALLFDDDDELDEKWVDQREVRVVNGMVDSILRGTGIAGAVVATTKNVILEFIEQDEKGYKADNAAVIVEALNISPPIGSKARKLKSALDTYKYNKDLIKAYGYDIDNPLVEASANIVSAATNVPLDRALRKYDNITGALDADNTIWQRILMSGGWSKWDVGVEDTEKEEIKAKVKEEKKQAKKEARKESKVKTPEGNDPVPTYQRQTYKR